jgi:hypothetical protein
MPRCLCPCALAAGDEPQIHMTAQASHSARLRNGTPMEPPTRASVQPSLMGMGSPRVGFEGESFTAYTNGHGNCPLNWQTVVVMTTSERRRW